MLTKSIENSSRGFIPLHVWLIAAMLVLTVVGLVLGQVARMFYGLSCYGIYAITCSALDVYAECRQRPSDFAVPQPVSKVMLCLQFIGAVVLGYLSETTLKEYPGAFQIAGLVLICFCAGLHKAFLGYIIPRLRP